jgi:hypothetical protein
MVVQSPGTGGGVGVALGLGEDVADVPIGVVVGEDRLVEVAVVASSVAAEVVDGVVEVVLWCVRLCGSGVM